MNRKIVLLLSALLAITGVIASMEEAAAARMGGGRSFGGRSSFSSPYQRSRKPLGSATTPSGKSSQQPGYAAAQQRNQAARSALAQRGGLARFLGGMALGGLLGALFFGGAFENINFFDLLIFGGIALLLFKLLAARRASSPRTATPGGSPFGTAERDRSDDPVYARQSQAGFDTDILSRKRGGSAVEEDNAIPADFDVSAFLSGAESAYRMMQKAWDEADLATLRGLTTDKVFAELQDQIHARGGSANQTDLLKVETELLEVRDTAMNREVAVLFDVLMRENPDERPGQVREVWHFTRALGSRQPTWFLDGIQQLED